LVFGDRDKRGLILAQSLKERFISALETCDLPQNDLKLSSCALGTSQCDCKGVGVRLNLSGPIAKAAICACVKQCQRCGGLGRVIQANSSKPCKSPDPAKLVGLFNATQLPTKHGLARLQGFDNFTGNGRAVVNQIRTWMTNFESAAPKGLLISGAVGVGKTYLLSGIAYELLVRGISVRFIDFFQLLAALRSSYSSGKGEKDVMEPLRNVDVLIIDEMGKGRNTEWEQTVLDSLVMERYNSNRIIIAATNHPLFTDQKTQPVQLDYGEETRSSNFNPDVYEPFEQRVGKRIFSRMVEMSIFVELKGEDFRRVGRHSQPSRQPRTPWN
jgi:DNA replication protein DnaC